jgi:hypothetical protein
MSVTAPDTTPLAFIEGEPVSMQPTRIMLGWLPESEAVRHLLGRNAGPQDDLTTIKARIAAARAAVNARPPLEPIEPVIDGDRAALDAIAARPELQAAMADAPWSVQWVDLRRVLSIQKLITTAGLDVRVGDASNDEAALAELCLPSVQIAPPTGAFTDSDGLGFTISSRNPNLRAVGSHMQEGLVTSGPGVQPQKVQAITFFVTMGTSYLQVARYQGRCFLRDGYHRATGLLRAGVTRVPAVVTEAPSFQYVTPAPGLFDHEVAFSDQPPSLADFWHDAVSADGTQPVVRKVVRIRADQIVVQG